MDADSSVGGVGEGIAVAALRATLVGTALQTEGDIAVHAEVVGAGEVGSAGDASCTSSSAGDTVLDCTVTGTGVGGVVEGVKTIDAVDAAGGVGAVDAVGRADHALPGSRRNGVLCSIAGLAGVVG